MQKLIQQEFQQCKEFQLNCKNCEELYQLTDIMIQQNNGDIYCISCANTYQLNFRYMPELMLELKQKLKRFQMSDFRTSIIKELKQKCKCFIQKCISKLKEFESVINQYCKQLEYKIQAYENKYLQSQKIFNKINPTNCSFLKDIKKFLKQTHLKHDKYIINLDFEYHFIKSFVKKMDNFKLQLPTLEVKDEEIKIQSICKTQILSVISYKSRLLFGTAQGQIIYKAHDSIVKVNGHEGLIPTLGIYKDKLLSGGNDRKIKVWKIQQDSLTQLTTFGNNLEKNTYHNHMVIIENISRLFTSSTKINEHKIRVWCLETYNLIYEFKGHTDYVNSIIQVANTNNLLSSSSDCTIRIWNYIDHVPEGVIYHQNIIHSMKYNTKSNLIILYDKLNYITIYPFLLTQQKIRSISSWKQKRPISNLLLLNDEYIAVSYLGGISIYNYIGQMIKAINIDKMQINVSVFLRNAVIGGDGVGNMYTIMISKNIKTLKLK